MPQPKPAALFDFDLTLTRQDSFLLFARYLIRCCPGAWLDGLGLLCRAVPYGLGWVSKESMKSGVLSMLGRLPANEVPEIVRDFNQQVLSKSYLPQGMERIAWHKQQGHTLVLASASPDLYLEPISRQLGFDVLVCSKTSSGHPPILTGANCLGIEKVKRLQEVEFFNHTDWKASFAYSDHISDLPMFLLCGRPVATNSSKALRSHALQAGWEIVDWR